MYLHAKNKLSRSRTCFQQLEHYRQARRQTLAHRITDMYEVPDAVPPIHAVSSHVATDKDPSK